MSEKLQKTLATLGLASRREIERWILDQRIKVNGEIATIGMRVDKNAKITIDNKPIKLSETENSPTEVLLYHKPDGEVCTRSDEKDRRTVFESLPKLKTGRWIMIGRLDLNSSGLLLFTNNGELANALMHPKTQIEREYLVRVFGLVTEGILNNLQSGVSLDGKMAKFKSIKKIKSESTNQWYKVVVTEGRNRLIRRLWETQNIQVNRLVRIRFDNIELPRSLMKKQFIYLPKNQVLALKKRFSI